MLNHQYCQMKYYKWPNKRPVQKASVQKQHLNAAQN